MLKVYYAKCIDSNFIKEKNIDSNVFMEKLVKLGKIHHERYKKIQKISNIEEKCRSLSAGLLVSYALAVEDISVKDVQIKYQKNNKPYLENSNIFYNISHTQKYVAVVISDCESGIDVETARKRWKDNPKSLERLSKKILSLSERQQFDNICNEEKTAYFTKIWTKKESYVKATGEGITFNLSEIDTNDMECFFTEQIDADTYLSVCCFENINNLKKVIKKQLKLEEAYKDA
ncbi:4'-phosphopantetheinyl transferase family protein [Lachnobacterium bovis]|uniref:4'-phosphopantetheinyl transferase n=1 Tax=Lachnobacterium bovis TaxID=140626 RepID=A0A1H9TFJ8_9FIRM|nr:4'-phosphopantetheinyl transferase superfamily protein [Lachnobacterium bovis]SER95609.1 4'-phosphopantetheinyl transferase [Lachnobacterium bovis]